MAPKRVLARTSLEAPNFPGVKEVTEAARGQDVHEMDTTVLGPRTMVRCWRQHRPLHSSLGQVSEY